MQAFYLLCSEKAVETLNHTIINEGDPCDKVIVIIKGEVEVFKKKLNNVYFDLQTRTLGIKEYNDKAAMLKSDYNPND